MNIYRQLTEASRKYKLPVMFHRDLTEHDAAICNTMLAGEVYVWILRRHGTEIFKTRALLSPSLISQPLADNPDALAFSIHVDDDAGNGRLSRITHRCARELAREGYNGHAVGVISAIHRVIQATGAPAATLTRIASAVIDGINVTIGLEAALERGMIARDEHTGGYRIAS